MLSWMKPLFQKEEQRTTTPGNNDQEDDGFLVVGKTQSERTTVVTSEFQWNKDCPPSYMEVTDYRNTPNNQAIPKDYLGNQQFSPYSENAHQSMEHEHANNSQSDSSLYKSAVCDVPFCVNPQLQLMWGVSNVGMPVNRPFEPSKFEYDFSLEYSILYNRQDE